MTANLSPLMTVEEVAEYLRVSATTVYALAKRRQIPAARIGRSWRISKVLLDQWFEEQAMARLHTTGGRR
jgi:excisionase family DNA binding protein